MRKSLLMGLSAILLSSFVNSVGPQVAYAATQKPANLTTSAIQAKSAIEVGSSAEWLSAKEILMHTPGDELFLGVVHPDAALFEKTFSIDEAAKEHQNYIRLLEKSGAKVHTVVATLLEGTMDKNGNPVEGPKLNALRDFARQFIVVDANNLGPQEQAKQEKYLTEAIYKLSPKALVKVILQQPVVHLRKTAINTGYEASYEMKPVSNLYFCRDQMITTPKGVVLSKMNSSQREVETKIIKFVLAKLGIKPIYEVSGNGRLEGGDFIPAGDSVFIGCGVRTNQDAIDQLLRTKSFGTKRVVVVNEKWHNQVQMHLDTYFNVINKDLAVLVKDRFDCRNDKSNVMNLTADVYQLENDTYKLVSDDIDFVGFLANDMKMKVIPVPVNDQLKYGVNFLTVKGNNIFAVDGVSQGYKNVLKQAGVNAKWINFSNMTGGYGAAHCVTQVLRRR